MVADGRVRASEQDRLQTGRKFHQLYKQAIREAQERLKRTLLSPKSCLLLSSVLICHCRRCGRRCVLVRFLSASYGMYDAPLKTPQNFLAFRIARLSNSQAESQSCQSVKQEYQVSS